VFGESERNLALEVTVMTLCVSDKCEGYVNEPYTLSECVKIISSKEHEKGLEV
jgi:hypothetical protein